MEGKKLMLFEGDCVEILPKLEPRSVDLVLVDPPYGITGCKWDLVLPFEKIWPELWRVCTGAVCVFGSEPFSSSLRLSAIKEFKYDWIWRKNLVSNPAVAKYMPMRTHEIVSVFSKDRTTYNPQLKDAAESTKNRWADGQEMRLPSQLKSNMHSFIKSDRPRVVRHKVNPTTVLDFKCVPRATGTLHPTQKPVALLQYLIKTYTDEEASVLDFCMGSGSTGVAAKQIGRQFTGIEKDPEYFAIAEKRIRDTDVN